jgi:redox-sensing transcriptional repressor
VCGLLVAGGVRRILTVAPEVLQVPEDVEVRRVDLAVELQILSFDEGRRVSRDQALPAVVTVLRPWLESSRSG